MSNNKRSKKRSANTANTASKQNQKQDTTAHPQSQKEEQSQSVSKSGTRLEKKNFIVAILGLILTIAGFAFTFYQIKQSDQAYRESVEQFNASGPKYSWFTLGYNLNSGIDLSSESDAGQPYTALVLSNTGRTGDTIVSLRRNPSNTDTMTVCIPEFNAKGELEANMPSLHGTTMRLESGESRVIILADHTKPLPTQKGSDSMSFQSRSITIFGDLTVFGASGKSYETEQLESVPAEVIQYYTDHLHWEDAVEPCLRLVDDERG